MSEPLVRVCLVSIPVSDYNTDILHSQVEDLGGVIVEEVITDKADEWDATIVFDPDKQVDS